MEVHLSINCPDLELVRETVAAAEKFLASGDWVHLDVADGAFTFHKTWNNPHFWFNPPYVLEAHLMIEEPEKHAEDWIKAGAKRVIVHAEALIGRPLAVAKIIDIGHATGAQVMLALNPETSPEKTGEMIHNFREFLVLAVHPGLAGQEFLPSVLEKVRMLRAMHPDAIIEIDGGMNPETATLAKSAGADIIVAATYILNNPNPKHAYETLKNI